MNVPELSLCFTPGQESLFLADLLKASANPLLSKAPVSIRPLFWGEYKQELVKMALQNSGVDLSQVGFPLTQDLIGMHALLPIAAPLIAKLGGEAAFHPTIWKIANRYEESQLWSIPWVMDPRAIFYWKDLLDQAGIDPAQAFATAEGVETTFERMQRQGVAHPWVLGMADKFVIIHAISSWVWGKGGDFVSSESHQAAFLQEQALDGMEAFFRLQRFMPAENASIHSARSHALFLERQAVATIADFGSLHRFRAALTPEMSSRLGVALPPGPPLLAGSDLVIWRHTRTDHENAHLLSALFSTEVQVKYSAHIGHLPVTRDALESLSQAHDDGINAFIATLDQGRLFASAKFGGMLELQLAEALTRLWATLAEAPTANPRELLKRSLEPLQRRFDMMNEH